MYRPLAVSITFSICFSGAQYGHQSVQLRPKDDGFFMECFPTLIICEVALYSMSVMTQSEPYDFFWIGF